MAITQERIENIESLIFNLLGTARPSPFENPASFNVSETGDGPLPSSTERSLTASEYLSVRLSRDERYGVGPDRLLTTHNPPKM
ncbi:hypothetical protein [Shinella granuli]|uniref:hypothetical protein n=1 Tax=Shinella granuli TaxID=323621 RepID=UPI001056D272|nr:hypothetical protein [Shinella granuli]